ncbi:MAG: peptidylprolyl isomerase [Candidatus Thorarchaeota archaeon]
MAKGKGKAGKVRVSHILVDKHSKALEIIERIKKGQDFAKMAKLHSSCPSKKRGGALPEFRKGQMLPEFERAAFALDVGQMTSEPVKTKEGYHIIKRTK